MNRQTRRTTRSGRQVLPASLICLCFILRYTAAQAQESTFRLQSAQGRVEIQVRGEGAWLPVQRGTRVASAGDRIRTGPNGSVYIVRDEGHRIALGPNTEVILREPDKPRGLRVLIGRALAFLTGRGRLEVRAPGAIAAAEGTVFQVDVAADGTTVLTVSEGQVEFFNDLGAVSVSESQQSTAKPGQPPSRPIAVDPSTLMAWEANLQTLIIDVECPQVSTDPDELQRELSSRQAAVQRRPQEATVYTALAAVLMDLARTDEAQTAARRAVELAPQEATARGVLGYALLQAGRPAEAQVEFSQAAQAQPDEARWQMGLGLVALGQRDSRPAVAPLQRAAELAPNEPLPRAYLAAAHLRAGDLAAAETAAAEAVRLGPSNHLANVYMAYVRLAQGRLDEAVSAGQRAVQVAPNSALAHSVLGTARFFAGNLPEARNELDRALELNPLSASTHLTNAKLLAAENEIQEALNEGQLAVSLDPQSAPARSTLGLLFMLNNDQRRAGREFQKALALDPSLSEARTGWGQVLARRGRFREALAQQKAAVSLDTDSAAAENNLGGVYATQGRMREAIQHLQRAIELQPEWGLPYANLALVHLEQNRFREALDAGERALRLGERSPFVHTVLARIYVKQGRTDRALVQLRQAVALDPTYPQARYQLARLYLQQGRSRDAVREVVRAVTTDPSSMVETRQYARTENTLSGGSYETIHYDVRHSDVSADGTLSYFVSGLAEDSGGWRDVNQDHAEQFGEVIVGRQADPDEQLALVSTFFNRTTGLPGPEATGFAGDADDRQRFTGYDAVLALRERMSPAVEATLKYSFRRSFLRFRNPGSLTDSDDNPFRQLINGVSEHSPEVRLDGAVGENCRVRAGYAHLWSQTDRHGTLGILDPETQEITFDPFSWEKTLETDTLWFEVEKQFTRRFDLVVGGYWGRDTGAPEVTLPKVVAVWQPDDESWLSAIVNPIFRSDALELAPVEALADPRGLGHLDFVEGGSGKSYELRYQRLTGQSAAITAAIAYQQVRGLLLDVEDPAWAGLPSRVLVGDGHRWVGDLAYEQWLCDGVTGRFWVRRQDSSGNFSQAEVSGTEWPYTPEWQGGVRLDYIDENGWRIGLEPVWIGQRFHDAENTERVDGYPLVNLHIQYQRNLHQNYFVDVLNLFDEDYDGFLGFPQAGTTVVAGIEYRF